MVTRFSLSACALALIPALVLAMTPASAEDRGMAQCEKALVLVRNAAGTLGMEVSAELTGLRDGGCAFADVVIRADASMAILAGNVVVYGSYLNWPGEGILPSGDIAFEASGMRVVPQTGDARMDYLLDAQAKTTETTLDFRASWDQSKKELRLGTFDLRLGRDSRVRLSGLAKNVDLSTPGAAQMALMGFAVTALDLEITSFGLFEHYMLPALVGAVPAGGDGFEAELAARRLALREGINALPDSAFPAASRAALAALLSDLPNPRGKLVLAFTSQSGFGPARLARFALTGFPQTMQEAAPLFNDTRFDIDWRRGDRS